MSCPVMVAQIETYLDGTLSAAEARDVTRHLSHCAECRRRLAREEQWRAALRTLPVAAPAAGFAERILMPVRGEPTRAQPRPGRFGLPVLGSAIAASLVVGLSLGLWFGEGRTASSPQVAENRAVENVASAHQVAEVQAITSGTVQTVRLAFKAGKALKDVTLTLELPSNVELASFPGQHSISWKVDLEPGQNLLALPLKVLEAGDGELVAHLGEGDQRKTFRVTLPTGARPS